MNASFNAQVMLVSIQDLGQMLHLNLAQNQSYIYLYIYIYIDIYIYRYIYIHIYIYIFFFFFLSGFSFTNIYESQDCRERGRAILELLTITSNRFTDP